MSKKKRKPIGAMQTNKGSDSSYLYWLLSAFVSGLLLAVVYSLLRNRSDLALNPRPEIPLNKPILSYFFPIPIESKYKWLDSIQFSIDASFLNTNDQALIFNYIKQQKEILTSTPLTPANKMALSKTTIHWIPYSAVGHPEGGTVGGFVSVPRKINVVFQEKLTREELRSILLNELHHVTIAEVNQHRVRGKAARAFLIKNGFITYPFLTDKGTIDKKLKLELSIAIEDFFRYVEHFKGLFNNKHRNALEEKEFGKYLQTIKDYHPKIYRLSGQDGEADFIKIDLSKLEKRSPLKKMESIFYVNSKLSNVDRKNGKVMRLLSANLDDSLLERARAFLYDITHSYNKINNFYRKEMKNKGAGEVQLHANFLLEISSEIDELLTTTMKRVFAKRFQDYFSNYTKSYLENENIPNPTYIPRITP